MPLTIVVSDYWTDGKRVAALGVITATGAYPGVAGDPLDLSPLSVGSGIQLAPIQGTVDITMPGGYVANYVDPVAAPADPGALTAGKVQVLQCAGAGAPNADIGAGAYPAALLASTWKFFAWFRRGSARG